MMQPSVQPSAYPLRQAQRTPKAAQSPAPSQLAADRRPQQHRQHPQANDSAHTSWWTPASWPPPRLWSRWCPGKCLRNCRRCRDNQKAESKWTTAAWDNIFATRRRNKRATNLPEPILRPRRYFRPTRSSIAANKKANPAQNGRESGEEVRPADMRHQYRVASSKKLPS